MKHTPGPWSIEDDLYILDKDQMLIATIEPQVDKRLKDWGWSKTQSNARLIVAAPDTAAERDRLRETLEMMILDLEHTGEIFETDEKRIEYMKAALSAAEGKNNDRQNHGRKKIDT